MHPSLPHSQISIFHSHFAELCMSTFHNTTCGVLFLLGRHATRILSEWCWTVGSANKFRESSSRWIERELVRPRKMCIVCVRISDIWHASTFCVDDFLGALCVKSTSVESTVRIIFGFLHFWRPTLQNYRLAVAIYATYVCMVRCSYVLICSVWRYMLQNERHVTPKCFDNSVFF